MRYKKIVALILVILLIFTLVNVIITNNTQVKMEKYDELIEMKISHIHEGIDKLNTVNNFDSSYNNIITLTEIKQDCKIVIDLICYKEPTNEELAVGDLLGCIYLYIRGVQKEELTDEIIMKSVDDLIQVNILIDVNYNTIDDLYDLYDLILEKTDKNRIRYPNNKILVNYNNRKVPEEYQINKE